MGKDIVKLKDTDSKGNYQLAEFGKVSSNGDFYFTNKEPWYIKLTWILDGIFSGLIYLTTATVLSFYIHKYCTRDFDRGDSKPYIFIQFCGEVMYLVFLLYIIIMFYGRYLPSIALRAPTEHTFLKNYICGFCTIFGLFVSDVKLVSKVLYVLGRIK
jgi:hypothetical protein